MKPVEEWNNTGVYCQYIGWYSRYLEDTSLGIILKRMERFSVTNLFALLRYMAGYCHQKISPL